MMNSPRIFIRLVLALALMGWGQFVFAEDYWWSCGHVACNSVHYPTPQAAAYANLKAQNWNMATVTWGACDVRSTTSRLCRYTSPSNTGGVIVNRYGTGCTAPSTYNASTGACEVQCLGDSTRQPDGSCALECESPHIPNHTTMRCDLPPVCPEGQFWDFESEACKWPEDDRCPVGSNWSPSLQDCVCDGDGVLSNAQGFRICMPPAEDACTPDSPDFKGYYNGYRPFCSGEARCPPGTTYGAVGKGDNLEHVCVPTQPPDDPDCPNGTVGNLGGKTVCVPPYGEDPDCPSGQSGTVSGKKVCLPDPDAPPSDTDCQPGDTVGYAGRGDDLQKVCVSPGYSPPTCKAGSYAVNTGAGFVCTPVSGGAGPGGTDSGTKPGTKPGTGTGGGTGTGDGTGGGGGAPGDEEQQPEPSVVGGESCATELRCQGDAVQCAILRKQKDQVCQWKLDGDVQSQVQAAVSGEGFELREKEVGVSSLFSEAVNQGRWLPSSCPAARVVTVMGRSYSFEWEPLCRFAEALGPLIVALASIFFAVFIGRGIKGG